MKSQLHVILAAFLSILFAIISSVYGKSSVYPKKIENLKPYELGEAILTFMPHKWPKYVPWNHRINEQVIWLDSTYIPQKTPVGKIYIKRGLLRIHVLGKTSKILKRHNSELAWTIEYRTKKDPKLGVEKISFYPGIPDEGCFGHYYSGCSFHVEESIKKIGFELNILCRHSGTGYSVVAYNLRHPTREATLVYTYSEGSGGQNAMIELMVGKYFHSLPCNI